MPTEVADSAVTSPEGSSSKGKSFSGISIDPQEQFFRRLLPRYLPRSANHIYVSFNTDYKNQLLRGKHILSSEDNFIVVHGLGAGIERAINLANEIKDSVPASSIASSTSGFYLNEDLALILDGDYQTRSISAIHMKISKPPRQEDDKGNLEGNVMTAKAVSSSD